MATRIYTKTGDEGKTSLIGGTRVSKGSLRIEAYGTVDELNAFIGWTRDLIGDQDTGTFLTRIQDRLFTIGSALAADPNRELKMRLPDLRAEDITELEAAIDHIASEVPSLRHFILPGGAPAVSICHVSRCVARRAERLCVQLADEGGFIAPLVIPYLNRLSDYLFMLGRQRSFRQGVPETPWEPQV